MIAARFAPFAALVLAAALSLAATGCNTDAFCFSQCKGESSSSSGAGTGGQGGTLFPSGGGGEGGCLLDCTSSSSGTGGCVPSNGGVEICDGADNDCNGGVDDLPGLDLSAAQTCGICANNCYTIADSNWNPATVTCTPPAMPGSPGVCQGTCAQDYYDLDADQKCEYYCIKTGVDDSACNNGDDDCDGTIDEDVDVCTSTKDCGACNNSCFVAHGTAACVHTGGGTCDTSNTKCQVGACDCTPGDCWWDIDLSYATGCEYPCEVTNGGVEICDGIDNDCNGKVDDAIPSVPCQGGALGVCALPANAGMTQCAGGVTSCIGAAVVKPGDKPETCNNIDDDCNGVVDNNTTDAVGTCGQSNIFPCSFGSKQCVNGAITCVGAVNPGVETCNGKDDDCDGTIDDSPIDAVGACNVPPPAPVGGTSPCVAGTLACVAGTVQCQGSVVAAAGAQDTCKVDANCDGVLTNQPNFATDVHNCGTCGNDCLIGAVHANWACVNSVCTFQSCQAGYFDLTVPKDNTCEYPCVFTSAQEICNGIDDNCNGQTDENVQVPTPKQVCGVSPQASAPECNQQVAVACQNGAWKCTFPANVCNPSCGAASEVCDTLDNNCNGLVNENVPSYGQPCASDDGLAPGHGACRTLGTFVCNGANATKCSAVKASCATLPGGCTELCDGIDNDCDGTVDETYLAKGTDTAFYVKPAVTKITNAPNLWVYSYEASRPTATTSTPGSGNGYQCNTSPCPGSAPVAPAGVTLDKTKACSVQGKIPWFNVTPIEAEQTCQAMGGKLCSTADWQAGCTTNPAAASPVCTLGYSPRTAAGCATALGPPYPVNNPAKFCNLGPTFDFDAATGGDQDGLLVTGSAALSNCFADFTNLLANPAASAKVYDVTGNLREITRQCQADATSCSAGTQCCSTVCSAGGLCTCRAATVACTTAAQCCSGNCTGNVCVGNGPPKPGNYPLMGGSFNTAIESGATCQFSFYSVDQSFQLFDLGFRCCFTTDPG